LILWTLASKPPTSELASLIAAMRSLRRSIASEVLPRAGLAEGGGAGAGGASPGSGGNCSPPRAGSGTRPTAFIGRATPKAGRAPAFMLPTLPFLPNALIEKPPKA